MMQLTKPVVLIVEDENLIRLIAVETFQDDGFVVLEAQDAAGALEICAAGSQFQVLFTDINMPGDMDGVDLAEYLKKSDPRLHIIITSALPITRSVDGLPATFIAKPYRSQAVCIEARRLLAA